LLIQTKTKSAVIVDVGRHSIIEGGKKMHTATKETMEEAKERMSTLIGLKIVDAGQVNGLDAVKLSQGPWTVEDWNIKAGKNKIVAMVYGSVGNFEGTGNANLIASAPEMLDLCKQALEHFRLINDPIHVLYAKVVAKAEGRV
jgi:hypothetical protein